MSVLLPILFMIVCPIAQSSVRIAAFTLGSSASSWQSRSCSIAFSSWKPGRDCISAGDGFPLQLVLYSGQFFDLTHISSHLIYLISSHLIPPHLVSPIPNLFHLISTHFISFYPFHSVSSHPTRPFSSRLILIISSRLIASQSSHLIISHPVSPHLILSHLIISHSI